MQHPVGRYHFVASMLNDRGHAQRTMNVSALAYDEKTAARKALTLLALPKDGTHWELSCHKIEEVDLG